MNKKFLASGLLASILIFFLVPLASATTFGFYPLKISVKEGQTFRLAVNVNPNGQKNYTVKASVGFPADLVSVQSWQFGGSWLPLNQPGYDSLSNTAGVLVKTAGYSGGFDKSVTFGTITFTAKKTGTGVIRFTGDSMALDEANTNQYSGGGQVALSIVSKPEIKPEAPAPVAPVTPTVTPGQLPTATSSEINPPLGEEPPIIELTTTTPSLISPAEMKRFNANFDTLNSNLSTLIIVFSTVAILLFIMIIILMIGLLALAKRRDRNSNREPLSDISRVSRGSNVKTPTVIYPKTRSKNNNYQVSNKKMPSTARRKK